MRDLISRQAAIDALGMMLPVKWFDKAETALYKLPSAQKRGKWKPFDLTWGRSVYACSACGEAFEVPTEMGKPIYTYCPNCGARMEAE